MERKKDALMSSSPIVSPAQLTPTAAEATRGEVKLRGPWLRVLQIIWIILVLDDLSVLIVGVPAFYNILHVVCTRHLRLPKPIN